VIVRVQTGTDAEARFVDNYPVFKLSMQKKSAPFRKNARIQPIAPDVPAGIPQAGRGEIKILTCFLAVQAEIGPSHVKSSDFCA
jgi:hypothetical protein